MAEIGQRSANSQITPVPILFCHPHDQSLEFLWCRGPARTTTQAAVILAGDQFPVPTGQGLRRGNGRDFGQHPSSHQPSFGGEAAALIVCEAKSSFAQLSPEYPVFFPQVFDRVLLLLIHPPGNNEQQKAERIYALRHRLSSLPLRLRPLKIPFRCSPSFRTLRDPPPGNTVMWRGLSRLTDIQLGFELGTRLVGN